jgi:hypothetical protein
LLQKSPKKKMENFNVLATNKAREKVEGIGAIFSDQLLVQLKDSKYKEPSVCSEAIFNDLERIKNFNVFEDDVFLCGFPRSGTTLTQEMIWLILHDFDFKQAENVDAYNRAQWFDYYSVTYPLQGVEADNFEKLTRPRVFKTHYPVQLLPPQIFTKNARMIFISRDVKDVAVSLYYCRKTVLHEVIGTMEEHFDDFLNDRVFFGPYREYLKNFEELKGTPNILFLTYEGVVADREAAIKEVAKFLGKEASDENIKKLVAHLDFKTMQKNPKTNMKEYLELFNTLAGHKEPTDNFIRKGVVGGHTDEMSEEYIKKFNDFMAEAPKQY